MKEIIAIEQIVNDKNVRGTYIRLDKNLLYKNASVSNLTSHTVSGIPVL